MKASNANIIAQLNRAREGLIYSCAGDSTVGTCIWEVADKGEFSLENMFKLLPSEVDWIEEIYTRCNQLVKAASTYRTVVVDEEKCVSELYHIYLKFFEFLLSYLPNLEIYKITIDQTLLHYHRDTKEGYREAGRCYIGITRDGDWIGIAYRDPVDFLATSDEEFLPEKSNLFGQKTHNFLQEIAIFMKDLSQSCRSHYLNSIQGEKSFDPNPFYIFNDIIWEVAVTKEMLLKKLLYSTGIISTRRFRGTRFLDVDNILRLHLRNLRKYNFLGTQLCWLGETQSGDWIGVTADCYPSG
ncbi:hypothetical protein [Nostoc sp.]|uniref:hypothetical protein n=1 Tax=Nostoc sp. TaxID=1180 RepID=UPI002FF97535